MSSDGHASDHNRSVSDESDEVGTEVEEATYLDTVHRRQGESGDGLPTEFRASEGDTSEDEVASPDGQHRSPDQAPSSYQVPSEESEYSPREAESRTSSDGQSEAELVPKLDSAKGASKTSRKRKPRTPEAESGLANGDAEFRPLKKAKGSFNRAYLDLLNEDIEHAAAQYVPLSRDPYDERIGMPASQIGMTVWTPMEKERFFEALGRLGQDDAAGIARRIRTKGEMEVRQYMKLLQGGLSLRRKQHELDAIELADFPAAVELSQDCCQALDEAADSIALRQEHSEETVELYKYGSDWLVTQESCGDHGDNPPEENLSDPTTLFNVPSCLKLSERIFMNGPSEQANWQSVEGEPPSIRRTTLDNFYSLTLTLTRRLVAASIFMATSRIRAERGYKPRKANILREKDVHAAALSLGLWAKIQSSLAGCPRRLGLHVYEEPPKATDDEVRGTGEPMTYDDVEAALGISGHGNLGRIRREMERIALSSDEDSVLSGSPRESEAEMDSEDGASDETDSEDEEIKAEAEEIIFYSAVDQPDTKRDRQALFRRIKAEREQEKHAEAVDARAAYQEESQMWALLGQLPPEPLVDPGSPPSGRRLKISVDASYSVGKDWRAKTKVMSEWESQYQLHR
ncbi:RNA polymerase I-specific transcription initiation factor rrn5 [Cytospora mali]|uniref:RNA polymerase I-specific transcription initiation factor rrn5 n=1 Tax=Cytospora mali TaxID=578113 RepID=A0A194VY05_CYTMA|nr:RNA polymerase I-specific transcription initiation factor rrn5 [Valsa mali]